MTISEELQALFRYDWDFEMKDNPEFAAQAGDYQIHDISSLDDEPSASGYLQDVSPTGYRLRKEHCEAMVTRVNDILLENEAVQWRKEQFKSLKEDEKDQLRNGAFADTWKEADTGDSIPLTSQEILCGRLFKAMHEECAHNISVSRMHLLPLNSMGVGGVIYSFMENVELMRFESAPDYESYLKKLRSFHWQIDMFIASLNEGIATGYVASLTVLRKVESQLSEIIASDLPALMEPLNRPAANDVTIVSPELRDSLLTAVMETKKGYEKFLKYFLSSYLPHARLDIGCSSLPQGVEMYQACLNYHTTTTLTPEEIHSVGVAEVEAIERRYINDVLLPLGYKPDKFAKFVDESQKNSKFFVSTPQELKEESPLSIESRTVGPAAYYLAGTADGKRPGRFYVNTSNITEKPLYEAPSLSLHEAIPGHHHQVSLALENESLPMFLRCCEDRRYEVCPARRNMYTSYIEGWALYCEYLGEEMGVYKTPHDLFGRLSMDMMRAVRLVVDTGLHAKGWSIEQSIEYMMQKTGMHYHEVEGEVHRYATWPGQATAYKIGQLEFLRLRAKAERELTDIFSLQQFHDVCLNAGPVPLSVLEQMVQKYIDDKLEELRVLLEEPTAQKKK